MSKDLGRTVFISPHLQIDDDWAIAPPFLLNSSRQSFWAKTRRQAVRLCRKRQTAPPRSFFCSY